ncbi:MAG: hypothetical protein KGL75_12245 [Acidobacteriota bacterium]|nr:hypothetical protein [Acidobacteriota bacterium]
MVVYDAGAMRAWVDPDLITVEGTPDEWRDLVLRIMAAYAEYNSTDAVIREFVAFVKQQKALEDLKKQRPRSGRRPDLEWYDKHDK